MFVRAYDNVVSSDFCERLIYEFDRNESQHIKRDNEHFNFDEINIGQSLEHSDCFRNFNTELAMTFASYAHRYREDIGVPNYLFPSDYGLEQIRMKRYKDGVGKFSPHIDAINKETSKRFLVMFLYLNEGEGGETIIFDKNEQITVARKPGRLLVFPPFWTFPHQGMTPIGNDKYIAGTYLHYED